MNMRNTNLLLISVIVAASFASSVSFAKKQTGDSGVEKELRFQLGDEDGNEVKALKTEVIVMRTEKKALDQILRLQKRYEGTRMEPEILVRLAALYMRRARTERFFEVHKDSQQIISFAPTLVKEASEAAEIRKAIVIYQKIEDKFPQFRSMDVVMFNNAYAYQQIGDNPAAEKLLTGIVTKFPRSSLVPDTYLALGEINFAKRQFSVALEHFQAIRKYPSSHVYPYGLYKAAWCYYNMQDAASGMKQLEEVVLFGRKVATDKLDSKLDLRKEALGDLALFYGDVMPADKGVDYLVAQAQEIDAGPYIMKLVELYKRHSRYKDVEVVLKDVLAKLPKSEMVATAHEELIWNYERTKQQDKAAVQLTALNDYCDAQVATVVAKKLKKGEALPRKECQDKVADTSKKLATKWHGLWKKQGGLEGGRGQAELLATAEKAYKVYLKSADQIKDADLPTVHFAYAELLFARGEYRDASANYAMIGDYQKAGVKIDAKVGHDAAYAAIVSLEKSVKDKWNDQDEKRFQALSEDYVQRYPKGEFVLELRFKRAFIAYEKEHYDEAAPQFKKIGWESVSTPTTSERILKSQDLYLDILNIKKDYKAIKEAAQSLLGKSPDEKRGGQISKIYREAYFSEIQQMEEKGNINGAIEAYKKFALENGTSDLAPKAWWNASQLQFRLGDAEGGANTCYQMFKLFPKSTNGRDCLTQASQTFESMARLDLAGRVLLNLALVETDKQDHWREVAADFFALSGGKPRAIQMYMKLGEGKKQDEKVRFYQKAELIAHEMGDTKTLDHIESEFTKMGIEPHASRMVVEQAEAAFDAGDLTKAFNTSKRIISRDGLPKELLARARFVQARVLEDEYKKQSTKARMEKIGIVLAIKTEKLEKAQKAMQSAINYGDGQVSVKALQHLAGMYLDYAKTTRGMTLPAGVPEADVAAFKGEIEQLSIPMEEKGIEAMNQALETAKKAQLRDGQIADLQKEVDRLNMKNDTAPAVQVSKPGIYVPKFSGAAKSVAANGVN